MCGIFGYVGEKRTLASLLDGLARLEYRGYDSCGVAAMGHSRKSIFCRKKQGKIKDLRSHLHSELAKKYTCSILHTRWATHGKPSKANAHPHMSNGKNVALVHNGIIENYLPLKEQLQNQGYRFRSETDTEVIVHLIDSLLDGDLRTAVMKAVLRLEGSFALGVVAKAAPGELIAVRKGSPLIIGKGENEYFLASDIPAILPFTREVIYLQDGETAVVSAEGVRVCDFARVPRKARTERVSLKAEHAGKRGYEHFMLKEINEQPRVIKEMYSLYVRGQKISFPRLPFNSGLLKKLKKIYITGCGTAYHAGLGGKYFFERHCGLDTDIDVSSEFRYRHINIGKNDVLIAISQSGETADTLAAVRLAKERGATVIGICNVLGSSLVKESHGLIHTLAGPEIGVASTKAYTAQLFALYLLGLLLASARGTLSQKEYRSVLRELGQIPEYQKRVLHHTREIRSIAKKFSRFGCFLFLGRGVHFPSALEGALKLKEISYIPAEGYPAGEMKHGPIALIDEYRAVVCIAPIDELYEKVVSNIQEIKARKGKVLGVVNYEDDEASLLSNEVLHVPRLIHQELSPLLVAVALQLFAYYVAKNLGCEIDQPRNLAKSVTVE
ncbi:MAG: glutamine--fructose-6-phosphate transaminase (isomerizing) [Candidatus Omnitrophica bacterium]|nr:glutamine--fructose-6-phosphate transaminase (isomerizing) [Candidatus Omnitrophota bacterium]